MTSARRWPGPPPWWRLAVLAVLVVVLGAAALRSNVRGTVVVGGAIITVAILRLVVVGEGDRPSSPFTDVVESPPSSSDAATRLRDTERTVQLATATAGDAHRLLRPMVSDVVGEWLRATHGIDLDHPDAARLVPHDLWNVVRPGRPRPEHPHGPGPTAAQVGDIVDRLEALP